METRIEETDGVGLRRRAEAVAALVRDAVEGGASIGFVLPFVDGELDRYVEQIAADVDGENRVVLLAFAGPELVGMVQLELPWKPNARHRAEVQKLLVLTSARRRGLGRELMAAVERTAMAGGRTLLVLDTATDAADALYRSLGYTEIGSIPRYAGLPNGELVATTIFAKELPR
jgi:ribosomal protein S18 acetylase RimI-like enzyme